MSDLIRRYCSPVSICLMMIASILLQACSGDDGSRNVDTRDTMVSEPVTTPSNPERDNAVQDQEQREEEIDTDPTGVYVFESREYVIKLRVMGTTWMATTTPVTGFGEDYDTEQTEVSTGSVQGTDLYEETGYIKVGELYRIGSRWSASMLFAGGSVTLVKR